MTEATGTLAHRANFHIGAAGSKPTKTPSRFRWPMTLLFFAVLAAGVWWPAGDAIAQQASTLDVVLRTFTSGGTVTVVEPADLVFGGPAGSFALDTDAADGDAIADRTQFGLVTGERVTLSHAQVAGFELFDISCNGGGPVDVYDGAVLVGTEIGALTNVEAITCFFDIRHVAPVDLTVLLLSTTGAPVDELGVLEAIVNSTLGAQETFLVDARTSDATHPHEINVQRDPRATHLISLPILPDHWILSASCRGDVDGRPLPINENGRRVGIAVTGTEGGSIECTVYVFPGLTLSASAGGSDRPDHLTIGFTGAGEDFSLDAGRLTQQNALGIPLAPGTYQVFPQIPDGWQLSSFFCLGSSGLPLTDATGSQIGVALELTAERREDCRVIVIPVTDIGDILLAKLWVDGSNARISGVDPLVADKSVTFTGDLGTQTIDFDHSDATYGQHVDLNDLAEGSYSVFEEPSANYKLMSVQCGAQAGVSAIELLGSDGELIGVQIPLSGGDDWQCHFRNRLPELSLQTFVSGANLDGSTTVSADLSLRLADAAGTPLDERLVDTDTTDGDTHYRDEYFRDLEPGRYTLTAEAPEGYGVAYFFCRSTWYFNGVGYPSGFSNIVNGTDPDGSPTISLDLAEVPNNFGLNRCDLRYEELPAGQVTVIKRTQTSDGRLVADAQVFEVSGTNFGQHQLDTDPATALPDRVTTTLAAGSHLITETAASPWTLSDITCTGGEPALEFAAGELVGVTLQVQSGSNLVCSFTNTSDIARVVIEKVTFDAVGTLVTDPTLFTFDSQGASTTASGDGTTGLLTITPGPIEIAEVESSGWVLVSTVCSDLVTGTNVGSEHADGVAIDAVAGDRLRCVFTNQFIPDRDGDGVFDTDDNCPDAANTDQTDWDRDGLGQACDGDDLRLPTGSSLSQGFWKKAFSDRGAQKFDAVTLTSFLDLIGEHSSLFPSLSIEEAGDTLQGRGTRMALARSQALAAWLNWANDGTTFYEEIQPSLRFGQLIDTVDQILSSTAPNDEDLELAKDLAEAVNVR